MADALSPPRRANCQVDHRSYEVLVPLLPRPTVDGFLPFLPSFFFVPLHGTRKGTCKGRVRDAARPSRAEFHRDRCRAISSCEYHHRADLFD